MPSNAAPAPAAPAAGQQRPAQGEQPQGNSMRDMLFTIARAVAIYMLIQFLMKQFLPQKAPQTTTAKDASGNTVQVPSNTGDIPAYQARPRHLDQHATYNQIPQRIAPIWPDNSVVDIIVTVSPSFLPTKLKNAKDTTVVFREEKFQIGNMKEKRTADTTITIPKEVQHNGTLFGHFFVGLTGAVLDPTEPGYNAASAYHFVYPLTQYLPRKKEKKTRNLLSGKNETEEDVAVDNEPDVTIASYYHPNASLSFVPGAGIMNYPQTHNAVRPFVQLEATGARDGTGQNSWYYPILFVNSFWQLRAHMTVLNETVKTMPMHFELNNLRHWQFHVMAAIETNSKENAKAAAFGATLPGGSDGTEIEMVKEVLLDTNPILLSITVIVSILHMLLEMLAFGSDIAHYRKKKDNVGISVRSILANVFMQSVILLYLIDQSANTSWMILGTQAMGICVELWKITTVVDVRMRPAPPGSLIPYRIAFEDKHNLSETEQQTKEYDEIAFKYMYWAAIPLLIAYAVYSLIYDTHKSWYSYVITTLVGSVYAYGFLMMVPSLYINYRLKSVAHLPAKTMMYKFLNTFIDDLFAFTIKMPLLHRLATFRDDIIFFIYLYQRWIYRIDYSRVNEFGQGGEDDDEVPAKAAAPADGVKSQPAAGALPGKVDGTAKATGADTGKASKRK
jgi:hypothetical protein